MARNISFKKKSKKGAKKSQIPKEKTRKIYKKPLFWIVATVAFLLTGFLTWLFISALSASSELTLNIIYELPGFKNLDDAPSIDYGNYAVAIDGEVVKENSEENIVAPTASTAKMILGLMIMEEKPFSLDTADESEDSKNEGETVTITKEMYDLYTWYTNHGGSSTKVEIGEEISQYDALMSVFLASSNNMADSLAIWAFGSLENYAEYANKKLADWGLSGTTVGIDASGFDESTTSSTSDLAKIGQKVLENTVLKEIVGTKEYEVPVAGLLTNTNQILGKNRIAGIKTGYIGEKSGYCLVSGYFEGDHIVTIALMSAPTRIASFNDSLEIAVSVQNAIKEQMIIKTGQTVGYYDGWWTGPIKITADEDLKALGWQGAEQNIDIIMDDTKQKGILAVTIGNSKYEVAVSAEEFESLPSFGERLSHSFGWSKGGNIPENETLTEDDNDAEESVAEKIEEEKTEKSSSSKTNTNSAGGNCTLKFGYLMLINPNFPVDISYIDARRNELVSVSKLYGIKEGNPNNGDNLLDAEAAKHLNDMVKAYEEAYPGHTFETRSCYRARGTTCGRLCAATGTSDHHTGLTCDLLDPVYGTSLDTSTYDQHVDWQWLYNNSYKYGFIDRFPAEWAGGSMSEPLNVDENGSTGLYETWHYRYVGVGPATEIATGKYNGGKYDSLEHYLKARGMVDNLKKGTCK